MPAESQLRLEEELKRAQALLAAEKRTLEMIASGAPLREILHDLCSSIDAQASSAITTILLMDADGLHLRTTAGPRMPPRWVQRISPLPIGPAAGSCGTAAFLKKRVITTDIATDPLWVDYREAAEGVARAGEDNSRATKSSHK
ncbi:MAG: hypothetical protein L0Z53_00395 [Acidobacteriales bacterium]|nr:hypothetical protein [Terriglobales bacterium]